MRSREKQAEDLTPLSVLVEEGFAGTAGTVGALVDLLTGRGFAIDVDSSGRLAVASTVAEGMRAERDEAARVAEEEAAERRRVATAVAAVEAAQAQRQQEATARRHARIRRLEQATGTSIVQLEIGLRQSLANAPNTGMSYDDRQRLEDRGFSLDELEEFVLRTYGVASLEEVGR
jgi:hypothetical protein